MGYNTVNLATEFEAAAVGPILAAIIGADKRKPWGNFGKLLAWHEARPTLDYEYDAGFGAADCHAVYAWTETQVLFVHEYDGATAIYSVPRNPVPCAPEFGGSSDLP